MKKIILACGVLLFSFTFPAKAKGNDKTEKQSARVNISVQELTTDMRSLLQEHVALTRSVIFYIINEQPGIDTVVQQIVENQAETANLMKRYYGADAGKELSKLLYHNITRAADVMIAYRNGHANNYEKADKKWKESTDKILAFLTQVNPNSTMSASQKILYDEMKYTTAEIMAIKNKDINSDDQAYNKAMEAALALADTLSGSIIAHFPERFQDTDSISPAYGQK